MDGQGHIIVTAAVIFKHCKVLIAKRKRGHMGYLWEFPGGKQEPGETLEACIAREIAEELGLRISVGPHLCSVTQPLNCQVTITLHAFLASLLDGNLTLVDHDEVQWVEISELDRYSFPEPDRAIVAALKRGCHGPGDLLPQKNG